MKRNLNVKVDQGIFDSLEEFRSKLGVSRAAAVSMILKTYLDGQDLMEFIAKNRDIKGEVEKAVKELEDKINK